MQPKPKPVEWRSLWRKRIDPPARKALSYGTARCGPASRVVWQGEWATTPRFTFSLRLKTALLPAQFEGELELPRIVGRSRLASKANRARTWVAELVDRGDIGAIEKVESISDDIEFEPFAERNAPRKPHIPLEEIGHDKAVAAEIADAARASGSQARNGKCGTAICQADIRKPERFARNER